MARRFQLQRRQQATRRKTFWIGGVITGSQSETNLGGNSVALGQAFDTRVTGSIPQTPFTIVRTRGIFNFLPASLAANQDTIGAVGILIVNGEAFDAGVGSVPTPWTESFDDRWFYHEYISGMIRADVDGFVSVSSAPVMIDSKAQRKVEFGDVIVAVIENPSLDAFDFFMNFRMLVKLS